MRLGDTSTWFVSERCKNNMLIQRGCVLKTSKTERRLQRKLSYLSLSTSEDGGAKGLFENRACCGKLRAFPGLSLALHVSDRSADRGASGFAAQRPRPLPAHMYVNTLLIRFSVQVS